MERWMQKRGKRRPSERRERGKWAKARARAQRKLSVLVALSRAKRSRRIEESAG